jgi:hypothetical protein
MCFKMLCTAGSSKRAKHMRIAEGGCVHQVHCRRRSFGCLRVREAHETKALAFPRLLATIEPDAQHLSGDFKRLLDVFVISVRRQATNEHFMCCSFGPIPVLVKLGSI